MTEAKTWKDFRLTMPVDLHHRFKLTATRENVPMNTLLLRIIAQYVTASEAKERKKEGKNDPEGIR